MSLLLPTSHSTRPRVHVAAYATVGVLLFSGGYATGAASQSVGSPVASSRGRVAQHSAPAHRRIAMVRTQTHA